MKQLILTVQEDGFSLQENAVLFSTAPCILLQNQGSRKEKKDIASFKNHSPSCFKK